MTLGVDRLTDEELLKVVMTCADMCRTSIGAILDKLEKKDIERFIKTLIKHKELWDK